MARLIATIDRAFEVAIMVLMAVVVVTIAADVIARYGFSHSLIFANELSRLAFIWVSFLVMPLGIGRGLHVSITSLEQYLSPALCRLVFRASVVLLGALMVAVLVGAWKSILARAGEELTTLPALSASWFYVPVAIGAAHSLLHLVQEFARGERVVRTVIPEL